MTTPANRCLAAGRILDSDEVVLLVVCPDCSGPEATEFAKSTLLGQRVALIYDESQGIYDRYGRTLAYLDKADGWDYSVEAARAGAAHAYVYHDKPADRYPAIAAAEQEARDTQRGLWDPPCYGHTESVPT